MKRRWHHPEAPESGRQYWRSLGELEDSPEFRQWLEREFPQGAAEFNGADGDDDGVSRRSFVKLMGAATALAGFGMTSCRRPERFLVPYKEHVEWIVPGKPLLYASAKPRIGGRGCDPLVVTTHEGRPTKVDGNPLHPTVSGGSDAFVQASILDLYDPDRSKGFLRKGEASDSAAFEEGFLAPLRESKGKGAALVLGPSSSPSRRRQVEALAAALPELKLYEYEALAGGAAAAELELFGEGVIQVPDFTKAEKILSLDSDFLGLDGQGEDSSRQFSKGRNPDRKEGMNRLYVVEPAFTVTGGMADHRLRLPSGQMMRFALLLAADVAEATGNQALAQAIKPMASKVNAAVFNRDWIREAGKDLAASKGKALVVAGGLHDKPLHLLVAAINSALQAYGQEAPLTLYRNGSTYLPGIDQLSEDLASGDVEQVIFSCDSDPLFDAPADLGLADRLLSDDVTLVHHGVRLNRTARQADWHAPGAHYLESWGDVESVTGVYSVTQPMILPLFNGLSDLEFLLAMEKPAGHVAAAPEAGAMPGQEPALPAMEAVKETFALAVKAIGSGAGAESDVDKAWNATLRDGYLSESAFPQAEGDVEVDKAVSAMGAVPMTDLPHAEALEISFVPSAALYDGRFANNGWMQEAPDPITKLTWDNAALISHSTATQLGLADQDLVKLSVGEGDDRIELEVPILINPGQADFTVMLAVGYYGEEGIGTISQGVGFDVYPMRTRAASCFLDGVALEKTGETYLLARTAEHYGMEGRALAREGTVEMYEEKHSFAQKQGMDAHIPENISLYKGPDYMNPDSPVNDRNQRALPGHDFRVDPEHQWGMTIDLNTCTGCNACTVACQAENNIPIVGKHQVLAGREMHWVRMDRYFSSPLEAGKEVASLGGAVDYLLGKESTKEEPGRRTMDEDAVEMISQPVACVQCEAAPCETVCPVNATVHTGDGLNAMTYNRCIGTRYCANNCPYKARRFNYFDYNKRPLDQLYHGPLAPAEGLATTTEKLVKNPNVTVRMRGVIEKCTYCVQRITAAKIKQKMVARDSNDTQVPANSIRVACQDACPSESIVFGNLRNPDDLVTKRKDDPRNYNLLEYLGVRPRTSYLARIRNPNMKMPGAQHVGQSTAGMH